MTGVMPSVCSDAMASRDEGLIVGDSEQRSTSGLASSGTVRPASHAASTVPPFPVSTGPALYQAVVAEHIGHAADIGLHAPSSQRCETPFSASTSLGFRPAAIARETGWSEWLAKTTATCSASAASVCIDDGPIHQLRGLPSVIVPVLSSAMAFELARSSR